MPTSAGFITWPVLRSVWQLGTKLVPGADENPKSLAAAATKVSEFSAGANAPLGVWTNAGGSPLDRI